MKPQADIIDRTFQTGGIALSALVAQSVEPVARATVLALPGGSYAKSYWHHSLLPDQSLLKLGSKLGFNVVALDRPGYGASVNLDPAMHSYEKQTDILLALVDDLPTHLDLGAGVFLIGHSMGGCISLEMGARRSCPSLLGIDVSGVPYRYQPELAAAVAVAIRGMQDGTLPEMQSATSLFYGPEGTYDPRIREHEGTRAYRGSPAELKGSIDWPERYPIVVRQIDVPVQITLGEHERVTRNDWDSLNEMAGLFGSSPRVVLQRQLGAGHNISHHLVGRAYHMRALTFFEECLALRSMQR
jgi:pimeloyl-ACP methyl ester carboxylesterase